MSKRYRLKKDIMLKKAGSVVEKFNEHTYHFEYELYIIPKELVENNSEYFELIKEEPKEVFTWDDALACEWAGYLHSKFEMGNSAADIPTILPQWKEKKQSKTTPLSKEIIEVTEFYYECSTANGKEYVIATNKTIPNEKHKDIIKAIEAVLNNEKLYTKFDVDILMKDAFTAGRGRFVNQKNGETEYDYPTLESYLLTLKEK